MVPEPWFSHWNYHTLQLLRHLPHSGMTDGFCDLLIGTPLLSTWVFAACFYRYWTKQDDQKAWRRRCLVSSVVAFGIAGLVTVVLRPWIHWVAPVLSPNFQSLFPSYRWGNGSENCFPSHSTLVYFMIALGFWPLNRRLCLWLSGVTLFFISLPRVYAGGHYPIDVLFSCLLDLLMIVPIRRWLLAAVPSNWHIGGKPQEAIRDMLFFVWVFELGEGFRSVESLAALARHLFSS